MKIISAFAYAAAVLGTTSAVVVRVARDATVAYNTRMCQSSTGTVPCNSMPQGQQIMVQSFKYKGDYERILLGFDLPPVPLRTCILHIPAAMGGDEYNLTVSATDNNWEEATVSGANKDIAGVQVAAVEWPASAVDIKLACDQATGNKLSLFVDTVVDDAVAFYSLQSGRNDVFMLQYGV
ncbi:hypothetical protein H4R19_001268 [Coemansia spiralis]|nr:hypothetical protein H4R19_001268 [Coemansia spiralis]